MRGKRPAHVQELIEKLKLWMRRKPKSPDDPYAYVGARKKPRLPNLSSAAVAELPEK